MPPRLEFPRPLIVVQHCFSSSYLVSVLPSKQNLLSLTEVVAVFVGSVYKSMLRCEIKGRPREVTA